MNESPTAPAETFSYAKALEIMDGEAELLVEIAELFIEHTPALFQGLREGVTEGDLTQVQSTAHTLKGSASNVAACRLEELARTVESLAKGGSLEGAEELVTTMDAELQALYAALREIPGLG